MHVYDPADTADERTCPPPVSTRAFSTRTGGAGIDLAAYPASSGHAAVWVRLYEAKVPLFCIARARGHLTRAPGRRSNTVMIDAAVVLFSYLAGSIASAILVCRAMGLPDPRAGGSGNPGATNVLRLGGKGPAALTLAGDVLKGVAPVLLAKALSLSPATQALSALAAFLGHLYPLYFRFRGGKGVATAFGAVTALAWPVGLAMGVLWLAVATMTRYSSLSSMIAAAGAPLAAMWLAPGTPVAVVLAVLAAFVLWRHRGNVRRLIDGTESRIGRRAA